MPRYIDADKIISDTEAMKQVCEAIEIDEIIKYIEENIAADVQEVKHGVWIDTEAYTNHYFIGNDHNACGCENAPCTCCHCWCENYQPDTPLTKAVKDNLDCFIDFTAYKGLKNFYGDILTTKGSIDPKDGKEYSPIAKTLYDILKARYGEKAE